MANTLFRFSVISLIFTMLIFFSCEQKAEKKEIESDVEENLESGELPKEIEDVLYSKFANAKIDKWTKESEEDMVIYDIEFKQGDQKFEVDIKADGTIYNWEKEIMVDDLPEAVKEVLKKKYTEKKIKEVMEISLVKDGKDVLEGYEIVFETFDAKEAEVTVAPDGKILEESGEEL